MRQIALPGRNRVQWMVSPISAAGFGFYILLGIMLYYPSYKVMVSWWRKGDYTYCYLIPLLALYLIWEKRERLLSGVSPLSWFGVIPLVLGISCYWLGELGGEFYSLYLSSWLLLVGICWLHFGWEKVKALGFVYFLLLMMFPLPEFIYNNLSVKLQLISSQLGTLLMRSYGMAVYREGNVIDLGTSQLQVVEACSGLRYLIPLLVLALILAHFYKAAWWKKGVFLLSAIPLAIFVNGFRIALTGFLANRVGPQIVEGFSHEFSGWVVFMVSLGVLLIEMWVLSRIPLPRGHGKFLADTPPHTAAAAQDPSERDRCPDRIERPLPNTPTKTQNGETEKSLQKDRSVSADSTRPGFRWWRFMLVVSLIMVSLILSREIDFRPKIPLKRPFADFPLQIDQWRGQRQIMPRATLQYLHLTDYLLADYINPAGKVINFYVSYYANQQKKESIHTPATCLPGNGWILNQTGIITVPVRGYGQGQIPVNRAVMTKLNSRRLVYYWFPQRGRILTNIYQLKFYAFWDALTRQRTDGALIRLITPISAAESTTDADRRLQSFVREICPILNQYIPGNKS